jgi:short-subunit dehydrogenase involved in D-alanine esterification of teichoic acids
LACVWAFRLPSLCPTILSFVPTFLYDLNGRVSLVTRGSTGVGLLIAKGLGAAGAKVYIAGRRKEVLDKIVGSWDPQHGKVVAYAR